MTAPASGRPMEWPALLQRVLIACLLLAGVRASLFALKDAYLDAGLFGYAARSFARHLLEDGSACLLPAFLLGWSARKLARTRLAWLLAPSLLIAGVSVGYLFLGFRWPARPFYAPVYGAEAENLRAWLAHGGAGLTAVLAVAVLWSSVSIPFRRTLAASALAVFAGSAGVLLLAGGGGPSGKPNLILISLDTLRRDRLGCYGYGRPTSPELDRFAAKALRFTRAFTPQPWTLTAHMSMLTGLYPTAHGVRKDRSLPAGVPTLAKLLGEEGYTTMAVVNRILNLDPRFGFARGFDYYRQLPNSVAVKRDLIRELLDDADDSPLFLFLHFYDAHSDWRHVPYEAHMADVEAFAGSFDSDHAWCDDQGRWASKYLLALAKNREILEGETLDHLESLYDAGVRSMDRQLGRLLADFEERGLFESSVILITADHGEEFFEHGQPLHSQCYDECVSVPFLLYTPWGEAGTRDVLASLVDVTPTFLELAGAAATETQGLSLAPLTRGGVLAEEREVVLVEQQGGILGLRGRGWSLVPRKAGPQLFDMSVDPAQTTDLLGSSRDTAWIPDVDAILEREAAALQDLRRRFGVEQDEVQMTPEELDRLRALGYADDG